MSADTDMKIFSKKRCKWCNLGFIFPNCLEEPLKWRDAKLYFKIHELANCPKIPDSERTCNKCKQVFPLMGEKIKHINTIDCAVFIGLSNPRTNDNVAIGDY